MVSKRLRKVEILLLGVVAALCIVFVLVQVPGSFVGHELNMYRARQHHSVIGQALVDDPEFARLELGVYTGRGGAIAISGSLPSIKRFEQLRETVDTTSPPVAVAYFVRHSELLCYFADFEPKCDDEEFTEAFGEDTTVP